MKISSIGQACVVGMLGASAILSAGAASASIRADDAKSTIRVEGHFKTFCIEVSKQEELGGNRSNSLDDALFHGGIPKSARWSAGHGGDASNGASSGSPSVGGSGGKSKKWSFEKHLTDSLSSTLDSQPTLGAGLLASLGDPASDIAARHLALGPDQVQSLAVPSAVTLPTPEPGALLVWIGLSVAGLVIARSRHTS